ncbi:MAG: putative Ig domain-containing protein [Steroidobacteraceae bacterium]
MPTVPSRSLLQSIAVAAALLPLIAACQGDGNSSSSASATRPRVGISSGGNPVPIAPANQPPQVSGTPGTTVTANSSYAFQPSARDPEGQALSFSIANLPNWASFDTRTGRLSGTPDTGSVGTYRNVTISVTDGLATASLSPFSIEVKALPVSSAPKSGSATLSWQAPTSNSDGSALTNLAGYVIYYGASPAAMTNSVRVDNPGITRYVVESLDAGTYHFAVSARNAAGLEGPRSATVSKTIS